MEEFLLRKLKREAERRQLEAESTQSDTKTSPDEQNAPAPDTELTSAPANMVACACSDHTSVLFDKTEPPPNDDETDDVAHDRIRLTSQSSDVEFDEQQFLRQLTENAFDSYIYDSASDAATHNGKSYRVTAVQTDY